MRCSAGSTGGWHTPSQNPRRPACAAHAAPPPPSPKQGTGGAAPAGGTGGLALHLKTSEGGAGGIAAHAKPDPSLMEGAGQDKTIRPHRRADAGVRAPRHTPLAKSEQLCYSIPMKSADSPLLFLGACRIHEHCAKHRASPAAGALREQPKGQDPPRKPGTGACAVIRRRRFGAIPLHDGSVTVRYGTMTVPLQFHDGFFTVCYAL